MHYVNNKEFYRIIKEYKTKCREAEAAGKVKPRIPDMAAIAIQSIANRYASKPSFALYSYKEDMIGDAILACIKYFDNFNDEKYDNPFSYFTQFVHNAFVNRINIEQKQAYIKAKELMNTTEQLKINGEDFNTDGISDVIDVFEDKLKTKKDKATERKEKNNATNED